MRIAVVLDVDGSRVSVFAAVPVNDDCPQLPELCGLAATAGYTCRVVSSDSIADAIAALQDEITEAQEAE